MPSKMLPVVSRSLQSVQSELAEGYRLVSGNKLSDAREIFRSVLQALLLVVISSDDEAKQVGTDAYYYWSMPLTLPFSGGIAW